MRRCGNDEEEDHGGGWADIATKLSRISDTTENIGDGVKAMDNLDDERLEGGVHRGGSKGMGPGPK